MILCDILTSLKEFSSIFIYFPNKLLHLARWHVWFKIAFQSAVANALEFLEKHCSRETGWINMQTKCNPYICSIWIALLSSSVLDICLRAIKRVSVLRNNTMMTKDMFKPTAWAPVSISDLSQTSHIIHLPL